jgi:hypothetical protein
MYYGYMNTQLSKQKKVATTLHLTKEAQDTMLDNGYCGIRGMGEFISQLIMEYHAKQTRPLTKHEIAAELRQLADMLEEADLDEANPMAIEPMPLANVIDAPSDMVGVTVISEEPGSAGE